MDIQSTELLVSSGLDTIACSFSYTIDQPLTSRSIILPKDAIISLKIELTLNNQPMEKLSLSTNNALQVCLLNSNYWKQLQYTVETESKMGLNFRLKCGIFSQEKQSCFIESNNSQFNNDLRITGLSVLQLNIKLYIPEESDILSKIVAHVNYCFSTVLINMELQAPLCFSYYGRRYFQENFASMRSISSTLTENQDRLMSSLLYQLNCKISKDYNFIEILKGKRSARIEDLVFNEFLNLQEYLNHSHHELLDI